MSHTAAVSNYLYLFYTVAYLALLTYGALLWRRQHRTSTLLLWLVTFGVFYDNLILTLGNWLGNGELLLMLSVPRFVLHQVVLPWILYAVYLQARQAGQRWAQPPWVRWGAMLLSAAVMAAGIATRLWSLQLQAEVMDGVLRYVAVGTVGPPIVSIVSIGLVGVIGLAFWRSDRWPWVFLAVVAAFIGESLPDESQRRAIGSALEVVLLLVLFVTQMRLDGGGIGNRE